jgi:hypothetical protein
VDQINTKAKQQGVPVAAKRASAPTEREEGQRSSDELLAELRPLIGRAQAGDEEASFLIRNILEGEPNLAHTIVEIAARKTERVLLKSASGDNVLLGEAWSLRLAAMRDEIAGPTATPLERLLAERIVLCRQQLEQAEAAYARNAGKLTMSQGEYHQRRLDRLHRCYLSAIRALAQIRRLLKPAVTQINYLAEKQMNLSS